MYDSCDLQYCCMHEYLCNNPFIDCVQNVIGDFLYAPLYLFAYVWIL